MSKQAYALGQWRYEQIPKNLKLSSDKKLTEHHHNLAHGTATATASCTGMRLQPSFKHSISCGKICSCILKIRTTASVGRRFLSIVWYWDRREWVKYFIKTSAHQTLGGRWDGGARNHGMGNVLFLTSNKEGAEMLSGSPKCTILTLQKLMRHCHSCKTGRTAMSLFLDVYKGI